MTSIDWSSSEPTGSVVKAPAGERLLLLVFALSSALGAITLIEPAPTDLAILLAILLWAVGGFRLHISLVTIIGLFLVYLFAGFLSLTPFWNDQDGRTYQFTSIYLVTTLIFMAIFISEKTEPRMRLWLNAYTFGAVAGCLYGLAGYLNLFGLAQYTIIYETRIAGAFKDPNVFSAYMVLAAVYLLERVISGRSKHPVFLAFCFGIVAAALLLAFSRGAWGATLLACSMMYASVFLSMKDRRLRQRMIVMSLVIAAILMIALLIILTSTSTGALITERSGLQEYDGGVTGRFGNQLRSLPLLLDSPNGIGPLRFRIKFGIEPHSSYVNAFASNGWIGGITWLCIVGSTSFIGFRLMYVPSPYRNHAQVLFPALLGVFLQAFQIDVDHWRHMFLWIGAIWGLEAARLRWVAQQREPYGRDAQEA